MAHHLLRGKQGQNRRPCSPRRRILNTVVFLSTLQLYNCLITISYAADSSAQLHDVDPAKSLLKLKQSFTNSTPLSTWDDQLTQPCSHGNNHANVWKGVVCSKGGNIYGLFLDNMGLSGRIDMDALSQLTKLRAISFSGNNFKGKLPDIKRIPTVKAIYFTNNGFDGTVDPGAFDGMKRLRKVHWANNKLTGEIPISLTNLPKLVELRLEGNRFQGRIPEFKVASTLNDLNLANNQLDGPIPATLSHMNPQAFAGNKGLCGMPLKPCLDDEAKYNQPNTSDPQQLPVQNNNSVPVVSITPIIIGAAVVIIVALLVIFMILQKELNSKSDDQGTPSGVEPAVPIPAPARKKKPENLDEEGSHSSSSSSTIAKASGGKLCFVREAERFDLLGLLRASAEILGSGCFGSSYKANLRSGQMMVVKRYKHMNNVRKEDFQEHMRRLGRLEHQNVLPLTAYYYRKEEKLLVCRFAHNGSLAMHLHGNHSRGQQSLDWPTRLKIIQGVAKGLDYLYKELPCLIAPHGHLKSSNVLLDESFNPLLSDFGLIPLINQESAQELMVAYKSPEYVKNGRLNKKTDVWSLGILIIETLTGEFPASFLQQVGELDLTSWVKTVVGDQGKGSTQVFDKNMTGTGNGSFGEMQKLLNIGLGCCESNVDMRLDIRDACERIYEVKERDIDDDFYSSYASSEGGDRRSSRGLSDDFTVIVT